MRPLTGVTSSACFLATGPRGILGVCAFGGRVTLIFGRGSRRLFIALGAVLDRVGHVGLGFGVGVYVVVGRGVFEHVGGHDQGDITTSPLEWHGAVVFAQKHVFCSFPRIASVSGLPSGWV